MRRRLIVAVCLAVAAPAFGADMNLTVEIPTLKVAEYHRPYVAVWIEREDHTVAANLAVWYDVKKADGEGTKWLKDMRQWWRRSGREQTMPIDGVSGATRPAGQHQLSFSDGKPPLGTLAPGHYELVVEAAREVGGREMQRIPFDWPSAKPTHLTAQGKDELGLISLDLNP
ncbi:hypothetical protein EC912_10210 [Luteibacter rhizovicinus]|uniref:DUF2271 domain-containing protein n=1 Tax=Luteibacter rhizovicinus TaxID=242606 RepID=A0A4R3YRZ6_9GAMM|nr:DUF2271 domain-containing protein [Luteibacter rhizovicinus]TCV95667.1 hypothetical protein EC912_10210 [Luteibacter rhizovicinus]